MRPLQGYGKNAALTDAGGHLKSVAKDVTNPLDDGKPQTRACQSLTVPRQPNELLENCLQRVRRNAWSGVAYLQAQALGVTTASNKNGSSSRIADGVADQILQ